MGGITFEPTETKRTLRLKMDASPVLDYLAKNDLLRFGALGPVSMLRAFAKSVTR